MKRTKISRALSKTVAFDGNIWCGYLTPSDIMVLVRVYGVTLSNLDVDYILRRVKNGDCRSSWYYFEATPEFLARRT